MSKNIWYAIKSGAEYWSSVSDDFVHHRNDCSRYKNREHAYRDIGWIIDSFHKIREVKPRIVKIVKGRKQAVATSFPDLSGIVYQFKGKPENIWLIKSVSADSENVISINQFGRTFNYGKVNDFWEELMRRDIRISFISENKLIQLSEWFWNKFKEDLASYVSLPVIWD
jgi:hypothetical protein